MKQESGADRITIGVIILTLNEEKNLALCLESIKDWANEILIVDSYSSDGTLDIARSYHVPVLQHKCSPFMISTQRNWSLTNGDLLSDWILFLDADEVATEELKLDIVETLCTSSDTVTAFRLTPQFMFLGRWLKHCLGYPNWHDRLVKNGEVTFSGGVWEYFVTDGEISNIHTPYIHYGFNKGIANWFDKHNRYSDYDAQDIVVSITGQLKDEFTSFERTKRKRRLRDLAARFWYLRPLVKFVQMYFLRLGFLDGFPGLLYSLLILVYEFLIYLKVMEIRRRERGLPI